MTSARAHTAQGSSRAATRGATTVSTAGECYANARYVVHVTAAAVVPPIKFATACSAFKSCMATKENVTLASTTTWTIANVTSAAGVTAAATASQQPPTTRSKSYATDADTVRAAASANRGTMA